MNDNLESRLFALTVNRIWFWACLVFALCLLDPLPIDPIPFFGVPGAAVSLIFFWISYHLHFNRHKRLRMSAIVALAEDRGDLTVNMVAEKLKIKKEKAESLLEEMLETDMLARTGQKKKKTTTYSLRP
ncbi:MAG: hypothetical protein V1867_02605 [Candidatus Falkowbacteria bacterium]